MKFLAIAATTLLAATVSANLFGSSPDVAPLDSTTKVPGDNPLQHCADPKDDILDLYSVDLSPNPPKAGTTLSVTAKGTLNADVTEGAYVQLQVKYGLITIIRQKADLCDTVKNVNLECPLHKDKETALQKDVDLPKEIPPGKYTVVADVFNGDGSKITCLTATVEFHREKSASGEEQVVVKDWKQGL